MRKHSIRTRNRETVAERVPIEVINRLQGLTEEGRPLAFGDPDRLFPDGVPILGRRLIYPHRKKTNLWIMMAGVTEDEIRAELRRDIQKIPAMAEANRTIEVVRFSNEKGSGWLYAHSRRVLSTWAPSAALAFDQAL